MSQNDQMSVETKEALQARDVKDLEKQIVALTGVIERGFQGVHTRQDTTNGKVIKAEDGIVALTSKFEYNRIIWYLLTTSVSLVVGLVTFILFKT